jgi:hypothetical protein
MDTLHFEPRGFHPEGRHPEGRLPFRDEQTRGSDELNLSEVEVFMLRGRRLQAQAIGGALRQGVAKLRRLLRRSDGDAGSQPGRHRHA